MQLICIHLCISIRIFALGVLLHLLYTYLKGIGKESNFNMYQRR